MKLSQVAVQLYTVRERMKTREDIVATLRTIRSIGYTAVQACGRAPFTEAEFARAAADAGLRIVSTHEDMVSLLDRPARHVELLRTLGCTMTAYAFPLGLKFDTSADVRALAARLNEAGRVFHEAGMTLAYHNHEIEFRRFDGRTMLEILYAETDPRYVQAELDTYWVQFGGQDPATWCRKMRNRLPMLHLKDYAVTADRKVTFCEIGNGNLDFPAIIAEAERSGCRQFIVEQDFCPGDPFDSLRQSFEYIRAHLCRE